MEIYAGIPVASVGPLVASIFGASLKLNDFACLTFSQSGHSPDIAALQRVPSAGGAKTVAVLNVTDSPVGQNADCVLSIRAGPERAVAATKSFVGMLVASLGIMAGYLADQYLIAAIQGLPEQVQNALVCDWSMACEPLMQSKSIFCVGRGPSLAIAAEAVLKLKETCRLHAEALSATELLPGPVAIAGPSLGALLFSESGAAKSSIGTAFDMHLSEGTKAFVATGNGSSGSLPVPKADHPLCLPLLQVVAFYVFVEQCSLSLGQNPDAPTGLRKVTQTV